MPSKRNSTSNLAVFIYPMLFVLAIWVVFWIEVRFDLNLKAFGIRPHNWKGLRGILFGPFIHGGLSHIFSNTVPLLVLSMAMFYFYYGITRQVLIYGTLLTGILTWLIASKGTTHIGASGVIYLMVSFLFFKGIWSKNYRLIALSLTVVFLYGSLIWGVFPGKPRISWEGHLSGFISGVVFAILYHNYQVNFEEDTKPKRKISPKEAEFLRHFDEDGNFIPSSELQGKENKSQDNSLDVKLTYFFKTRKDDSESN